MSQAGQPGFSRRGFLGAGTAAVGVATARSWARPVRPGPAKGRISEIAWRELARRVSGPVIRPGDENFSWLTIPNNLRYSGTLPRVLVRCRSAADVATSIRWARENQMPLIVRAGGHSYAGYSTTTGLMIDTTLMNGASFNAGTGVVTLQGGALNGNLYEVLRKNEIAVTHGRCPTVGAAGFLLGGGIGFAMRMAGYAVDHMVASEIVLADGSLRRLSTAANPGLFWACRGGGGGNFGVNTSFSLQSFTVKRATVFQMTWSQNVEAVAATLMTTLEKAPLDWGSRLSIRAPNLKDRRAGKGITIDFLGQFQNAKPDDVRAVLEPVFKVAQPDPGMKLEDMTYWDAQSFLDEFQVPTYFQERSAFWNEPMTADALGVGFKFLKEWPGTSGKADLRFFQTGGKTNALKPGETAFVHRQSLWLMVVGLYWNQWDYRDTIAVDGHEMSRIDASRKWQDAFYAAMLPHAKGGAYQNFSDPSLTDWRQSYYGDNLAKLMDVKKQADPNRVFDFPQAI